MGCPSGTPVWNIECLVRTRLYYDWAGVWCMWSGEPDWAVHVVLVPPLPAGLSWVGLSAAASSPGSSLAPPACSQLLSGSLPCPRLALGLVDSSQATPDWTQPGPFGSPCQAKSFSRCRRSGSHTPRFFYVNIHQLFCSSNSPLTPPLAALLNLHAPVSQPPLPPSFFFPSRTESPSKLF